MRRHALAALLAAAGFAAASPAAAQYFELAPRRAGVRPPVADPGAPPPGLPIPTAADFARAAATPAPRTGELRLLIIPALFRDSPVPRVTPAHMRRVLFEADDGLTAYYAEVSGGRFAVTGTVVPWVRTGVPLAEAAGERNGHGWIGPRMRDYVHQAIDATDPFVDFGAFDNDGPDGKPNSGDDDGLVDGLAIKYLEIAGSCGGPGIWPHFAGAGTEDGPYPTSDRRPDGTPIRVRVYFTDSATDCDGEPVQTAAVFAHELGHLLGLPDYYVKAEGTDREQRHWALGCFDLMAAGSWGCGTGAKADAFGPTHLSAYTKFRMGWVQLEQVVHADREEFVLEPVQTSGRALQVFLAPGSRESFIIEYRPRLGFDRDLPDDGVLIYHHDAYEGPRYLPAGLPPAYGLHLVEADGDNALRKLEREGGNRGVAEDMFARGTRVDSLTAATTPSTADHMGNRSTVVIHSIRVEGGVARIVLSAGMGFYVAGRSGPRPTALAGADIRLTLAGGSPPYAAALAADGPPLPAGLAVSVVSDQVIASGRPLQAGLFAPNLRITDAAGGSLLEPLLLDIADPDLPLDRIMQALVRPDAGPLSAEERQYLDLSGNGNDRLDVGDVRALLGRRPPHHDAEPLLRGVSDIAPAPAEPSGPRPPGRRAELPAPHPSP